MEDLGWHLTAVVAICPACSLLVQFALVLGKSIGSRVEMLVKGDLLCFCNDPLFAHRVDNIQFWPKVLDRVFVNNDPWRKDIEPYRSPCFILLGSQKSIVHRLM